MSEKLLRKLVRERLLLEDEVSLLASNEPEKEYDVDLETWNDFKQSAASTGDLRSEPIGTEKDSVMKRIVRLKKGYEKRGLTQESQAIQNAINKLWHRIFKNKGIQDNVRQTVSRILKANFTEIFGTPDAVASPGIASPNSWSPGVNLPAWAVPLYSVGQSRQGETGTDAAGNEIGMGEIAMVIAFDNLSFGEGRSQRVDLVSSDGLNIHVKSSGSAKDVSGVDFYNMSPSNPIVSEKITQANIKKKISEVSGVDSQLADLLAASAYELFLDAAANFGGTNLCNKWASNPDITSLSNSLSKEQRSEIFYKAWEPFNELCRAFVDGGSPGSGGVAVIKSSGNISWTPSSDWFYSAQKKKDAKFSKTHPKPRPIWLNPLNNESIVRGVIRQILVEELTKADKKEIDKLIKKGIEKDRAEQKKLIQKELEAELKKSLGQSFFRQPGKIRKTIQDVCRQELAKEMQKGSDLEKSVVAVTKKVLSAWHELLYKQQHIIQRVKI